MKIAVCVKFVPVVSRIEFDYENKVIQREGVPSEINPFDLLGINMAVDLKDGDADSVIALSMGPPNAAEGLTQCYALGADPGGAAVRPGVGRQRHPGDGAGAGPGPAARGSRPHRLRAQQQRRRDRPGGAGSRRADGTAPHQQRPQAGGGPRR